MNISPSASFSGLSGTNLNLIATLLRDSILHLCKVSKIYDGWMEVDGLICISGKVEGQQLVVKVHESFRPQESTKNGEGRETFGDNCERGYEAERSYVCDGNTRFSSNERKRKRLDSGSETARSSSAFRQYDHRQDTANASLSPEIDYKNDIKDMSMKKLSASGQNCTDVVAGLNNTSREADSASIFPYAAGSATIAYQVDEMQASSFSDPPAYLGGSIFRPRPLGANGERWNVGIALPECRVCGCSFENSEALSDHNEAVHSLFTCLCCFKTFTSRSNLERHSRLHTGHRPYTCSICGKSFSRKDHLSNHATKHAFKCGTCSKRYADRSSLISHYHLDHCTALTNICAYCNKGFSSQEAFEDHVKIHPQFHLAASGDPDEATADEKPEGASQLTGKGYRHGKPRPSGSSLLAFYKHRSLLERANHALYTCLVCSRAFDHPWKYSSHLSMHPNETNVFKCCLCQQVCSTLAHLRQHEAAHFGELSNFLGAARLRSFSGCDQTLETAHRFQNRPEEPQQMNQLQRLYMKERLEVHDAPQCQNVDFACGLCDVRFADQTSLLRHLEENDHHRRRRTTDDTKILKRGKRKQMQPKIVVALERNVDEGSEIEVVEPESPTRRPILLQRDRKTPERFDQTDAGQVAEDASNDESSSGIKIRLNPIRSLMCGRTLALGARDWDNQNKKNGANDSDISKHHTEVPLVASSYERSEECLGREEITKKDQCASYSHSSPYNFSYASLASDGFQSSENYRSFQRCQSSEGFLSVSTTPSDSGGLNNNNNNIASLRNENSIGAPSGPPYLCAFCESKTETFAELDAHCQVEHSRSPCMFCAKTFAQKANRDRHHCLHTGDRPYGCPECDERFSRGDKLKMHRVRMHGIQYPAYSSRQKGDANSSRDYSTSPLPGSSYPYDSFEQQVAFPLGHSQPPGNVDVLETEEGYERQEKKVMAVSSQGDCSEEDPDRVSERRSTTTTTRQIEVVVPDDFVTNSASL